MSVCFIEPQDTLIHMLCIFGVAGIMFLIYQVVSLVLEYKNRKGEFVFKCGEWAVYKHGSGESTYYRVTSSGEFFCQCADLDTVRMIIDATDFFIKDMSAIPLTE